MTLKTIVFERSSAKFLALRIMLNWLMAPCVAFQFTLISNHVGAYTCIIYDAKHVNLSDGSFVEQYNRRILFAVVVVV